MSLNIKKCDGCLLLIEEAKKRDNPLLLSPEYPVNFLITYCKREKPEIVFLLCHDCCVNEELKKRL